MHSEEGQKIGNFRANLVEFLVKRSFSGCTSATVGHSMVKA